jgi:hypothetical protein
LERSSHDAASLFTNYRVNCRSCSGLRIDDSAARCVAWIACNWEEIRLSLKICGMALGLIPVPPEQESALAATVRYNLLHLRTLLAGQFQTSNHVGIIN